MKVFVDIAILALLLATGAEAAVLSYSSLLGSGEAYWEYLELDPVGEKLPGVFAYLSAGIALATWISICIAFWPLHKLMWARSLSFSFVGRQLKLSAYACFGFWVGSTLMFVVIPAVAIWLWKPAFEGSPVLIPLGVETVFLVLSLVFVIIGRTLERAETIEDEMKQIL